MEELQAAAAGGITDTAYCYDYHLHGGDCTAAVMEQCSTVLTEHSL